ncbi:MAG: hypothetical protein ACRDYV_15260, partial [Acidimicrobiia bacterium]
MFVADRRVLAGDERTQFGVGRGGGIYLDLAAIGHWGLGAVPSTVGAHGHDRRPAVARLDGGGVAWFGAVLILG